MQHVQLSECRTAVCSRQTVSQKTQVNSLSCVTIVLTEILMSIVIKYHATLPCCPMVPGWPESPG